MRRLYYLCMKTLTQDSLIVAPRQDLITTVLTLTKQNDELANRVTELSMELEWFKRQVFGTKSERHIPADELQMALELDIATQQNNDNANNSQKDITYKRSSSQSTTKPLAGHGRGTMPQHLPIKETTIIPDCDVNGLELIGEEISWYYEMDTPSQLHIVKIIRPKYAQPQKSGIVIGKLPELPVNKGNAGPGLITHFIIEKFLYSMPLDRQRRKFKSEYSVDFSESWIADCVKNGCFWIEPVYNELIRQFKDSSYLQADETPIPVLTKDGKGKTHRGYFWVYHDPLQKMVVFDYRQSRSREGPNTFLREFRGTLQIDGYEGYSEIITRNNLVRGGCMDHVRRRFEAALQNDPDRANYALDTMRSWYDMERMFREQEASAQERLVVRKEKVAPLMHAFKTWMQKELVSVLPKSFIGIALQYALNQWDYFNAYLNDGRIELSNILVENAIRPVALGRKNFMFMGSHNAAERAAMIYSVIATAKLHGIDPFHYIKDLLTRLPNATTSALPMFTITNWNK